MDSEILEEIHTEIKSAWKKLVKDVVAKNIDSMLEIFTEDPILVINVEGKFESREEVRPLYNTVVNLMKRFEVFSKHIYEVRDKIYETGTVKEVMTLEGKETVFEMGYVCIWKKVNGHWKVSEHIYTPIPE